MSELRELSIRKGYSFKVIGGTLRLWKNGSTRTMPFSSKKQAEEWLKIQADAQSDLPGAQNAVDMRGLTQEERYQATLQLMNIQNAQGGDGDG
jgi:hypothetical protein